MAPAPAELDTSKHGGQNGQSELPQTEADRADKLSADSLLSEEDEVEQGITFKVWDIPPWPLTLVLGFQHYLTMLGATVLIPTLLVPAMGGSDDDLAQVIQSIFFTSGLVTLGGTLVGNRLPIIQGGSFSFITPAFAIIATVAERDFDCPEEGPCDARFKASMRELQGAIIGAALFQVFIGYSGLMGLMLKFISPITIAPTIALVGLALFESGWGNTTTGVGSCVQIGIPTIICLIIFSQYLRYVTVKIPRMEQRLPIFTLFPVLLSIVIMWLISLIYTEVGDPSNVYCRSDNSDVLSASPWIRFPYPGQFGAPTFTSSSVFAMFAGVIAGMIESVGDYYACARLAGAPPPPVHVVSRGIGWEGIGCIVAGVIGTGNGTTSYSENVGAIGLTGVGSRRVVQVAASFMVLLSIIGKFGALFASLPTPIIGGLFCVMFGMITGIGLSNAQYANQASMRNIFIIGFALYNGLSISAYFAAYTEEEGHGPVNTPNQEFNDIVNTYFETAIAVGLLVALILDNTLPGSKKERGLDSWNLAGGHRDMTEKAHASYDLPFGLSKRIEYPILDWQDKVKDKVFGSCHGCRRKPKAASSDDEEHGDTGVQQV